MFDEKAYGHEWYLKNRERILEKQHQERRNRGALPKQRFAWTDQQKCEIVNRLLTTDATTRSIASEFGCQKGTVEIIYRSLATKEQRLAAKVAKQSAQIRGRKLVDERKKPDPVRVKARSAVNYAIRSGKINRANRCQVCQVVGFTEAHHWRGYQKEHWLDVLWVCRDCHRRLDRESPFEVVK